MDRRTFLAAAGVATAVAAQGPQAAAAGRSIVRHCDAKSYHVRHSATFVNGDTDLTKLEIWIPVARSDKEQQISDVNVPPPTRLITDQTGTGDVAWYFPTKVLPAARESTTVEVSYTATVSRIETDMQALGAIPWKDAVADQTNSFHTRRETRIEIDDPRIAAKARELRHATSGPGRFAFEAYRWVLDKTRYQLHDGVGGARYCLDNGSGECGDYSVLFVALCRAAGIPARPVLGYWLDGKRDSWHVWAEFLIPTGEWVPVDGAGGDGDARQRLANFGQRDNRRVGVMKTYDVKLNGTTGGHDSIDFLQVGTWWWYASRIGTPPKCDFTAVGTPLAAAGRAGRG